MSQPPPHPMQSLVRDEHGTIRFRKNEIVRHLLDEGPFDLNMLVILPFDREDHEQLAQLIGYSVSGFGDLSYVSRATCERADRAHERMVEGTAETASPDEVDGDMRIAIAMIATELEKQSDDIRVVELLHRPVVAESVRRAREYLEDALGTATGKEPD